MQATRLPTQLNRDHLSRVQQPIINSRITGHRLLETVSKLHFFVATAEPVRRGECRPAANRGSPIGAPRRSEAATKRSGVVVATALCRRAEREQ